MNALVHMLRANRTTYYRTAFKNGVGPTDGNVAHGGILYLGLSRVLAAVRPHGGKGD